jgi:formylmethanofuran dehydrogenase subunit C
MAEIYYKENKDNIEGKKEDFINFIINYMNQYNYPITKKSEDENNLDKIVSKKIVIHLEEFFKINKKPHTKKRKSIKNRLTKRKM